jgi:hypothetical protein
MSQWVDESSTKSKSVDLLHFNFEVVHLREGLIAGKK